MSRLSVVMALLMYAGLWSGLAGHWGWLMAADDWMLARLHEVTADSPGRIAFWRLVSDVFSPTVLRIIAVAGIGVALIRRRTSAAVFLALTVLGMGLVTVAAKALGDRPRPETALIEASSTAFPSGHALGIMVAILAFITVLWPVLRPAVRLPVVLSGAGLVVLVGFARVALNVHHPSDVLAGWALGYLYYRLCVAVVRAYRPRRLSAAR